jgi:transcriptional regulator with XRE-family HTH domain
MFDQLIFGEKLKRYRKTLGLTQEEIAEKTGVSGQAVSKWEKGECLPDCYNLKQLGDLFGVSLDILLETGGNNDIETVTAKIKQLATEYVWDKYSKDEKNENHLELGDDLWKMWKAIYFVEIGNRELQEREMNHGMNRINGDYGTKAWDDNGIACVVKSSLRDKLDVVGEKELKLLETLVSSEYFTLIRHIDCQKTISKSELAEKTGFDNNKLNEMLIYLTENKLVEFYIPRLKSQEGYKLTANRGVIAYLIWGMAYLLTSERHSTSEYLPG